MYILPKPRKIRKSVESFLIKYNTKLVLDGNVKELSELKFVADIIKAEVMTVLGLELEIVTKSTYQEMDKALSAIYFCLEEDEAYQSQISEVEQSIEAEEYSIEMSSFEISLLSKSVKGLLYAARTLQQIIRQEGAYIHCLNIEDAPLLKCRGLMLDVTRGRIPTLAELKRTADVCSFYKLNHIELYIEHSYMFAGEEEMWRDSTPLSASEILEFDEYCKKLHIELVPALASFGHLYDLLRTQKYRHLCELEVGDEKYSLVGRMGHHTIDVSNPESFRLITERIDEFLNLFSSKYFNICADETFDLCKGRSKALGDEKGVRRVYIDFLKKLCGYIVANGKTPLFWGDVVIEEPELVHDLPQESILLNWEYSPEVKKDNIEKLTAANIKNIYLCPGVQSWNHLINKHHDAYENISGMCKNAHDYGVLGVLNTEWGDLGHIAHPEFSTIGQIYGAAFSWSEADLSEEEINKAISVIEYGDNTEEIVDLLMRLADTECVNWWHAVQYKEEQDGSINTEKNDYKKMSGILFDVINMGDREKLEVYDGIVRKIADNKLLCQTVLEKIKDIKADKREDIAANAFMGEGQLLISYLACLLEKKKCGEDDYAMSVICSMDGKELAASLEKWFLQYEKLWRSVSKESELFRLREVFDFYEDLLGTME